MTTETASEAAVTEQMARIFAGARPRRSVLPAAPPLAGDVAAAAAMPPARVGWLTRLLAPLVVAIAIGVALAVVMRPAAFVAPHVAPVSARPVAPPVPGTAPASAPTAPPPQAMIAQAPVPRPAPFPAGVAPAGKTVAAAQPRAAPHRPIVVDRQIAPDPPAPSQVECDDARDHDACLYRAVRRADGRLRRAYRRAEAADVSYAEMLRVRRQWADALDDSLDAPERTIRTYDRLAMRLDDARADARAGRVE